LAGLYPRSTRSFGIRLSRLQAYKRTERRLAGKFKPKTTATISARMGRVRQAGTEPELRIRRALTHSGIRYRTKNRDLPGSPDIANRSRRWAIFVQGCFWHHHNGCVRATIPKANRPFWKAKFAANKRRDAEAARELRLLGYEVLTLWECETHNDRFVRKSVARIAKS